MMWSHLKIFVAMGSGMMVGVATQTYTLGSATAVLVMMIPNSAKEGD